jgi:hypothetical protein
MQPPLLRLAEEHERLHPLPRLPHTVCFGEARKVNWQPLISVGGSQYSVPHELVDERVWTPVDGQELIVVHIDGPAGPRRGARHALTTPGRPTSATSSIHPGRLALGSASRAHQALRSGRFLGLVPRHG